MGPIHGAICAPRRVAIKAHSSCVLLMRKRARGSRAELEQRGVLQSNRRTTGMHHTLVVRTVVRPLNQCSCDVDRRSHQIAVFAHESGLSRAHVIEVF